MTEEAALAIYDNYDVHHRYDNNLPITRYRQDVSQSVVSVIIFCGYLSLCLFIHLSPQGAILCVYAVPRCLLVCHSALLCQNRLQLRSHWHEYESRVQVSVYGSYKLYRMSQHLCSLVRVQLNDNNVLNYIGMIRVMFFLAGLSVLRVKISFITFEALFKVIQGQALPYESLLFCSSSWTAALISKTLKDWNVED